MVYLSLVHYFVVYYETLDTVLNLSAYIILVRILYETELISEFIEMIDKY